MWPVWERSPRRSIQRRSPSFSCRTFKDVESLVDEKQTRQGDDKPEMKKVSSIFHRVWIATSTLRTWSSQPDRGRESDAFSQKRDCDLPEKKIVLYFTSLRVVRKTFEDCRSVRSILRGFRVWVDERDLSMDPRFMEELQRISGGLNKLSLPRVFIAGKYIGGAEEIRQMHETGELKRIIDGFPTEKSGVCDSCGGFGFLLCHSCNGSHKCYLEKGGFRACLVCNKNGLIRCPSCCS